MFGVLRFLAGVGLGGCLPTAIAMVNEFTRSGRSGRVTTTIMTGYHVGAVATAALAIVVIPNLGWRWMFVIGALPAVVLVPLMLRHLPESAAYLASHGRCAEAEEVARRHGLELEDPAAPVAAHVREADYDLGAQLAFLLVLNVGAIVGLLVAGTVADRIGARAAGIGWFAGAAILLALLSVRLPIAGIYVMVFLTGCFVFSAHVLVYAFVSANHPPQVRATALGWSAGAGRVGAIVGPVITGALFSAGLAFPWGFYVFAVVGGLGALAFSLAITRRSSGPHRGQVPSPS